MERNPTIPQTLINKITEESVYKGLQVVVDLPIIISTLNVQNFKYNAT